MLMSKDDLKAIGKLNLKHPYVWVATWFGSGFMRPGPGTWGSFAAIPFCLILYKYAGIEAVLIALLSIAVLGFWASDLFDKATDGHDNKMIVVDEVVGQWIALLPMLYFVEMNITLTLLGFALFRFFDILKPWPICWLDKHCGGAAGVMLDDVLAGLIAALLLTGYIKYVGYIPF